MAFAAGAAAEWPALSVPLRMLAGLVGFSRVATGAHYPSDVLAGFALGETIAWLTTKVVPVERIDPMQDDLTVHAGKANPDGEGIALVINPKSGSGRAGKILPEVRRAFPRMRIVELGNDGEDYGQVTRDTAASCEVLAVAGGDGTVQQAAAAAMHNGIPLAVFPAGTFNHFAKDLGMFPLSAAIDAIHAGTYGARRQPPRPAGARGDAAGFARPGGARPLHRARGAQQALPAVLRRRVPPRAA